MADPQKDDPLKGKLSAEQYHVTQEAGTERPFDNKYWNEKTPGVYHCICCDTPLFDSNTKYDSGTGWPSFYQAIQDGVINTRPDHSLGRTRTEALCAKCGAHLGHVFDDGPNPTGKRYCMNSASLDLKKQDK